ncbi:MAG: ABC transporter permease subunit [bacterium]|nr:ABC transporter permease subunit [bacterium]
MVTVYYEKRHHQGRERFFIITTICVLLSLAAAVIFSYLYPYDGLDIGEVIPFLTDIDGRNLILRVIIGVKAYFLPGILAICISTLFGTALGIAAGGIWTGIISKVLNFFARTIMDVLESFPKYLIILLMITIIPHPNFYQIVIVLGIINSAKLGKMIMEKIISLKKREFIEATEALGIKKYDIILRHILFYNCSPLYLVQASVIMAEVILIEIGLSYIGSVSNWGLGVTIREPNPSWGNILVMAANHFSNAWWMSVIPLLAVIGNILFFYWVSDQINKRYGVTAQVDRL